MVQSRVEVFSGFELDGVQRFSDDPQRKVRSRHWTQAFSMGAFEVAAPFDAGEQLCEDYVINVPTTGRYSCRHRHGTAVVGIGDAAFYPAGQVHELRRLAPGPRRGLYLRIHPRLAEALADALHGTTARESFSGRVLKLGPQSMAAWYGLWSDVLGGLSDDELFERSLAVFGDLLGAAQQVRGRMPRSEDLRALIDHLESSPGCTRSLDDYAAHLGLSRFQLCRRFRSETGRTVHGYREQLRVARAVERLALGQSDLSGLAHELGYTSHAHFSARFRRLTGRSPSALRPVAAQI